METRELNKKLKNKNIHKNSPTSENFKWIPVSNKIKIKKPKKTIE